MKRKNPPAERRQPLTYSVFQLARRDTIVLKSSMRVLDHRFQHQWTDVHHGGDARITADAAGGQPGTALVLYAGNDAIVKSISVPLPLRASEVERAFNQMGEAIVRIRGAKDSQATLNYREDEILRLKRWPTDAIMYNDDRLRLGALISIRPCSLDTLQRLSELPMADCRAFVEDLMRAGHVLTSPSADPGLPVHAGLSAHPTRTKTSAPSRGLLARIRMRFGLATRETA